MIDASYFVSIVKESTDGFFNNKEQTMGMPMNENLQMSMSEYLRYPALSSSALAMADESMAKLKAYREGKIRFDSRSLDLGTAVHLMIESPDTFGDYCTVKPEWMKFSTKEGKAWKAENSDRIILDQDGMDSVIGCVESWNTSDDPLIKIARESAGEAEISRFFTCRGLPCKARADRLVTVSGADNEYLAEHWPSLFNPISNTLVVDFKTTSRSATPRSFGYTCRDFHYFLKAAHYLEAFKADAFLWVVMETSPPYHITRYLMSESSVAFYTERMTQLLDQIRVCEETQVWPGLSVTDEETLL